MTPQLQAVEQASGATFTRYEERELPARFGDVATEWAAVRQRCGLLDAGFRGLLRLTGTDRTTFMQGMLSNDVASLRDGDGTYAAFLTIQGRVVSDLRVYALTDELWLDVPAQRAQPVREALERFIIADDVEFVEPDEWAPLVVVEGPQAARVLVAVLGESVNNLPRLAHRAVSFDGVSVRVAGVTHTGEDGYLITGPPDCAATLWQRCQAAGAQPVGMEALDILRVEAGLPWHGRDMDDNTLISEVGLEAAISFTKGCYLGQEVVERVAARGQVQRKLVGLAGDAEAVPPPRAVLARDGKEAGWITSAVWSYACRRVPHC